VDDEILREHLDVYDTKRGWWNPIHGELEIPDGWDFLPQGDPFLTRSVKAAGTWWKAWLPRTRSRKHRRSIGVWAPAQAIVAAQQAALDTADDRARRREQRPIERERQQQRDAAELEHAVIAFLAFVPSHADVAARIARESAARATVISSGRVGRTRTIPLEERAALAARAYIRHRFTDYEADLDALWDAAMGPDDDSYRGVKSEAHRAVDEFLQSHRG
jgi:hypothetical protein